MKKLIILFILFLFVVGCEENNILKTAGKAGEGIWLASVPGRALAEQEERQARVEYMNAHAQQIEEQQLYGDNWLQVDDYEILQPDAYGLGVHKNRYGQAVTVRPDFGGVPGERLELELDAYGPGVHKDQYGRPVKEYPWP